MPLEGILIHPDSPASSTFSVLSEATTELEEMTPLLFDGSTLTGAWVGTCDAEFLDLFVLWCWITNKAKIKPIIMINKLIIKLSCNFFDFFLFIISL